MNRHPTFLLLTVLLSSSAQASTLYRCIDASGITLYTNQKTARSNCTVLSVLTPPAPKSGGAEAQPGGASKTPTPADFPKVAQNEQKARDSDRRSILMSELANERTLLDSSRRQLADALKVSPAPARSLDDSIALHERNIDALNKEIAKLH